MKALSVWQPWTWLIVAGHKDIENRMWSVGYKGPLLIHASKRPMTRREQTDWGDWCFLEDILSPHLDYGGIVGIVEVRGYIRQSDSPWFDRNTKGNIGWLLANPRMLPFIPMRGERGLWEVDPALLPPDYIQ